MQDKDRLEKLHYHHSKSQFQHKYKIILSNYGAITKKVSTTMLIRQEIGALPEAKNCTDRLLEGEEIVIFADSKTRAEELVREFTSFGVNCRVEEQE